MGELAKFFGLSFSALLPLINPVGDALVFLALVGTAPPVVYRSLAKKIAISTTVFLLMIELLGTAMLKFFGISLPVMQVAGGLALAAMGWRMLNEEEPDTKDERTEIGEAVPGSLERKIFYPFTFPITAGPGCIVVMVTFERPCIGEGIAAGHSCSRRNCARGCCIERSRVLLLWLRAGDYGAGVFADGPRYHARDCIRPAVRRGPNHLQRGRSLAEEGTEIVTTRNTRLFSNGRFRWLNTRANTSFR